MKKNYPQPDIPVKASIIFILGLSIIIFLWFSRESEWSKTYLRDFLDPLFRFSRSVNIFGRSNGGEDNEEKKKLEVQNSILEARVRELEALLNFPQTKIGTSTGNIALVSSQAPIMPYGTLLISFSDGTQVSKGMKAIAYGGVYLGDVSEVGERSAVVKLISSPGLQTEGWLERLAIAVTISGHGGQNMGFSLPKSIEIKSGDKIISNTTPQYLIGEIEAIEDAAGEPLQEIILRLPLNFKNLRYVELVR